MDSIIAMTCCIADEFLRIWTAFLKAAVVIIQIMLLILSPAKSLHYDTPPGDVPHTQPLFMPQAAELMAILQQKSVQQVAHLMKISDALSGQNVARFQAWSPSTHNDRSAAQPAVMTFNGNVYRGLEARTFHADALAWAQKHLCILSGLYGVLRPLDNMQPYRLDMGTPLATAHSKNLYEFWGDPITHYLNTRMQSETHPVVVNLASQEYFKAVNTRTLTAKVVTFVFEDFKGGQFKIISIHAKRARGLMARFAAMRGLEHPDQLKAFNAEGYAFESAVSEPGHLVFRRSSTA